MAEGRIIKPARIPETCRCGGVLVKDYHKHADGSHWCNRCERYCGGSSVYGCDMAESHPINCDCQPCPIKGHFCYGLGFYNPETTKLNREAAPPEGGEKGGS